MGFTQYKSDSTSVDTMLSGDIKQSDRDYSQIHKDLIDVDVDNIRQQINQQSITELCDSIEEVGLIQPVTVQRVGERFKVIAGNRRVLAIKKSTKIDYVDCVIADAESDEYKNKLIQLIENIHREEIDPFDVAKYLHVMYLHYGTHEKVAESINKQRTYVTRILKLYNINPIVKEFSEKHDIKDVIALGNLDRLANEDEEQTREILANYDQATYSVEELRKLKLSNEENSPEKKKESRKKVKLRQRPVDIHSIAFRKTDRKVVLVIERSKEIVQYNITHDEFNQFIASSHAEKSVEL